MLKTSKTKTLCEELGEPTNTNMRLVITRTIDAVPTVIEVNPVVDTIEFSMGLDFGYVYISRMGRPGQTIELADGDKAVFEVPSQGALIQALTAFFNDPKHPLNQEGGEA